MRHPLGTGLDHDPGSGAHALAEGVGVGVGVGAIDADLASDAGAIRGGRAVAPCPEAQAATIPITVTRVPKPIARPMTLATTSVFPMELHLSKRSVTCVTALRRFFAVGRRRRRSTGVESLRVERKGVYRSRRIMFSAGTNPSRA